uniref:EOG090X0K7I n=1 Tax=Daphnia lumholtzi TaxID=42856 RepID=A0A4Y7MFV7_9CRUS|nr:EOG090X0K7I [Daphnia lumholtzi]SVE78636.1 EOG090X0K7I [Daphnia lumholtzi]SVE79266.1 EOG090X0K7I [Daphnia lumholtzi]
MSGNSNNSSDSRRSDRIHRYKASAFNQNQNGEDLTPDYMNVLGMVFSMCGLMMRLKWCAWAALYCSCISFASSKINDDTKQILSSFMLSISAVVMSYLQNPTPMVLPWSSV